MIATVHDQRAELEKVWGARRGLVGWLKSVDHKSIARRFIVTALVFFVLAGLMAAVTYWVSLLVH